MADAKAPSGRVPEYMKREDGTIDYSATPARPAKAKPKKDADEKPKPKERPTAETAPKKAAEKKPTSFNDAAFKKIAGFVESVGAGAGYGVAAPMALVTKRNPMESTIDADKYREEQPLGFAVGEAVGSIPYALVGGKAAGGIVGALEKVGVPRVASTIPAAAAAGGLHGYAAGKGFGGRSATDEDNDRYALQGAAIGAPVGALAVPVTKFGKDVIDNLPAMTGRKAVYGADGDTTFVRTRLGQGTRRSAPLDPKLPGEGSVDGRATQAIRNALAQDEAAAVQTRPGALGRVTDADGNVTPFASDKVGSNTKALIKHAATSPGGKAYLETQGESAAFADVRKTMSGVKNRSTSKKQPVAKTRVRLDQILDAATEPRYHADWVATAQKMNPAERAYIAKKIITQLKTELAQGGAAGAQKFAKRLADPQFAEKLAALGVQMPNSGGLSKATQDFIAQAAAHQDGQPTFSRAAEAKVAERPLSDEEAAAVLRIARRPHSATYVAPDRSAPVLRGEYEQGIRFRRPDEYLSPDNDDIDRSVFWSQPVASGALSLSHSRERRQ